MKTDYPNADNILACASKKAYPDERMARRVAARLNEQNAGPNGRPGFEGVVVTGYACTRCGRYHIGRVPQGA